VLTTDENHHKRLAEFIFVIEYILLTDLQNYESCKKCAGSGYIYTRLELNSGPSPF